MSISTIKTKGLADGVVCKIPISQIESVEYTEDSIIIETKTGLTNILDRKNQPPDGGK